MIRYVFSSANKTTIQQRVSALDEPQCSQAASFRVFPQVLTALSYRRLAEPRAVQRAESSDSGG